MIEFYVRFYIFDSGSKPFAPGHPQNEEKRSCEWNIQNIHLSYYHLVRALLVAPDRDDPWGETEHHCAESHPCFRYGATKSVVSLYRSRKAAPERK